MIFSLQENPAAAHAGQNQKQNKPADQAAFTLALLRLQAASGMGLARILMGEFFFGRRILLLRGHGGIRGFGVIDVFVRLVGADIFNAFFIGIISRITLHHLSRRIKGGWVLFLHHRHLMPAVAALGTTHLAARLAKGVVGDIEARLARWAGKDHAIYR